jgi:hypothetical protein
MKNCIKKIFLFILLTLPLYSFCGILGYKYSGLKGTIYSTNNIKLEIEIISKKQLKFSPNCTEDLRNFLETMWLSHFGREAIVHLLKSKSKIHLRISDSIGAYTYINQISYMYAITGPVKKNGHCNLITEYDGKQTWEEMSISIFKGSFYFALGNRSFLDQGKVVIVDYENEIGEIKGKDRDSLINVLRNKTIKKDSLSSLYNSNNASLQKRVDPKSQSYKYKHIREFFYLTGVHEIVHTTTKNIALSRKNLDTESPAYKLELKARKRLKKVLKSKKLNY